MTAQSATDSRVTPAPEPSERPSFFLTGELTFNNPETDFTPTELDEPDDQELEDLASEADGDYDDYDGPEDEPDQEERA